MNNQLSQYRDEINRIDDEMIRLFQERMEICGDIAAYKKENGLPVLDTKREREKLADVRAKSKEKFASYTGVLYSLLFELSRSYQEKTLDRENELYKTIVEAIGANTNRDFPQSAMIACQGVEGAYSQIACDRMFGSANIMYFDTFDKVFSAIEKGLCRYGVLPIENSTAGSVNTVYDLMLKHRFYIAKSVRIKVDHNLLAKEGVALSEVKEILTHEQAIRQCQGFLASLGPDVKVTTVENTAQAAKIVAESDRRDLAALSSRYCAQYYGLKCLCEAAQDSSNNYTRFICISKELEIYPGADKTSIMMVLPHKAGALYKVLARLYTIGINLIKLESRPMPGRNFEFMFYFDLETSVYSEAFVQLVCELDKISEEFRYLGSYSEMI
ncbi:MAG: bifunctional chorismate mutase/prephenate dehydratase [Ruminococcaceae bacterium]|nr:bifunctional chorismate mutase/prephenate dehydratase [Oscillospiraceae bacterium]